MNATEFYAITTARRRCGRGVLLVDIDDGAIVAMTVRVNGGRQSIRAGEYAVLVTLLDRLGEVVKYAEFGRPQDSVRRDLGRLRGILEHCDIYIDAVPMMGYRLRTSRTRIEAIFIGDLTLDVSARRLTCSDRSVQIGETMMRVLLALHEAERLRPDALYTRAWGGVPHEIDNVVVQRVCDLRRALKQIESATRIVTLRLASRVYYVLRIPGVPALVARNSPKPPVH